MNAVQTLTWEAYEKAPGLRQSLLKKMARTPAHFKEAIDNPEPRTRDTIVGNIVHTALFEPDLLEKSYHLRPETYTNKKGDTKKWNGNATECKDWFAAHSDRLVITSEEHAMIIGIRASVMSHPMFSAILAKGRAEQCLFANDPDTGIQLKCRCDWLSGNAIVDLKSCQDASDQGFANACVKFGYDVQAAFYLDIAGALKLEKEHFIFGAVEKEPPYCVKLHDMDLDSIALGRSKYRRYMALYAHCSEMNEWPGYDPEIRTLRLPGYAFSQESQLLLEG